MANVSLVQFRSSKKTTRTHTRALTQTQTDRDTRALATNQHRIESLVSCWFASNLVNDCGRFCLFCSFLFSLSLREKVYKTHLSSFFRLSSILLFSNSTFQPNVFVCSLLTPLLLLLLLGRVVLYTHKLTPDGRKEREGMRKGGREKKMVSANHKSLHAKVKRLFIFCFFFRFLTRRKIKSWIFG